jgi:hypothetical protein
VRAASVGHDSFTVVVFSLPVPRVVMPGSCGFRQ